MLMNQPNYRTLYVCNWIQVKIQVRLGSPKKDYRNMYEIKCQEEKLPSTCIQMLESWNATELKSYWDGKKGKAPVSGALHVSRPFVTSKTTLSGQKKIRGSEVGFGTLFQCKNETIICKNHYKLARNFIFCLKATSSHSFGPGEYSSIFLYW